MSSLVFAHVAPLGLFDVNVRLAGHVNSNPALTGALDVPDDLAGSIDVNPALTGDIELGPIELAGSVDADPELTGDVDIPLPGDPHFANVSLLMLFDEGNGATTTADSGPLSRSVSVPSNNPVLTNAFGDGASASEHFNDASYVWEVAGHTSDGFGTGDFTIEATMNFGSSPGGNRAGFGAWGGLIGDCNWYVFLVGGQLWFTIYDASGNNLTFPSPGGLFSANTDYDICIDRDGTKMRMYVDGVTVQTSTTIWNMKSTFARRIYIGAIDGNPGFGGMHGIDNIRITPGVARYADDTGYTPDPFVAY